MLAIMPVEGRGYDYLPTRFMRYLCLTTTVTNIYMFFTYGYNQLRKGIVELDYISELIMVTGYVTRYYIVTYNRGKFVKLHHECRGIWDDCTDSEHWTVYAFVRKMQMLFRCFLVMSVMLNFLYTYSAFIARLPPIRPNGTETRALPFRFLTSGMEPSVTYAMLFGLQAFIFQLAVFIGLGTDTAAPFIIMFSSGYFRVFQNRLLSLQDARGDKPGSNADDDAVYEKLVACARFYQSVLRLCDGIRNFTEMFFLVELLCTGYNLSLCGIQLAGKDSDRFKFLPVFGLCLFQLYVCQWSPEFLLEESRAVTTAAYFASLAALKPRTGKLLMIIMQRSHRSVKLTAGGIIFMSMESFGSILKNAFSFFTVLRNFSN